MELETAAQHEPQARARARTYGTQFLFGYDPAFHRARCLVELGRLAEARALLAEAERSAVTAPSDLAALALRLTALEREADLPAEAGPAPPPAETLRTAPSGPPAADPVTTPGTEPSPGVDPTPTPSSRGAAPATVAASPAEARREEEGQVAPPPSPTPATGSTTEPPSAATGGDSAGPAGAEAAGTGQDGAAPQGAQGVTEPPPGEEGGGIARWLAWLGVVAVGALLGFLGLRRRAGRAPAMAGSQWHLKLLGSRLGGYQLLAEIGRGGMATTFRARRAADGRLVALKVPHPTGDPTYRERFLREGKLGEALHHPAIVRILEAGEDRGVPFLALELLAGRTLRAELDAHPEGLPLARALAIARAIAEALDYAHGKGVVHRDLKPENVMLLPDGSVRVMDFGVARLADQPGLTTSQFFLGSPVYAAPEAVEPQRIDHRADLYGLGILLFEMLQGRPPFVHESVFKLMEMHREAPLPAPATLARPLPPEVWSLIARLCAKDPADRHPSAQALLVELGRLIEGAG